MLNLVDVLLGFAVGPCGVVKRHIVIQLKYAKYLFLSVPVPPIQGVHRGMGQRGLDKNAHIVLSTFSIVCHGYVKYEEAEVDLKISS